MSGFLDSLAMVIAFFTVVALGVGILVAIIHLACAWPIVGFLIAGAVITWAALRVRAVARGW